VAAARKFASPKSIRRVNPTRARTRQRRLLGYLRLNADYVAVMKTVEADSVLPLQVQASMLIDWTVVVQTAIPRPRASASAYML
jgi:hypothetical protein